MNGTCQTCGATAPLEWFLTSALDKQAMLVVASINSEVSTLALRYLGLFRPASGKSVSPKKALRLLQEVAELIKAGHVQHGHNPARPCPPAIWAKAIETMLASDTIVTPLPNHNYLLKVAYPLADQADASDEKERNQQERSGNFTRQVGKNALYDMLMSGVENG